MSSMPNYYETLNVARTASAMEILASYNILKKMFGADPEMAAELDTAVMVLKDENSRAAYDRMMVQAMNKRAVMSQVPVELPPIPVMEEKKAIPMEKLVEFDRRDIEERKEMSKDWGSRLLAIACSLAIIAGAIITITTKADLLSRITFMSLDEIFPSNSYERPATAPNGQPFPEVSSYLLGTEVLENNGLSTLSIQNGKGESDVYLKLISHKDGKVGVARHVFVKAGSDFTVDKLSPGKYEIQYLDLKIGKSGRSELFEVVEAKSATGADEFSRLTVKLKTAVNGVLKVEQVPADEFNKVASL